MYLADIYFRTALVLCLKVRSLAHYAASILHYILLFYNSHHLKPISCPLYYCGYKEPF